MAKRIYLISFQEKFSSFCRELDDVTQRKIAAEIKNIRGILTHQRLFNQDPLRLFSANIYMDLKKQVESINKKFIEFKNTTPNIEKTRQIKLAKYLEEMLHILAKEAGEIKTSPFFHNPRNH